MDNIFCCRVLELVGLLWTRWGPPGSLALTRALVREMKNYVEVNGAMFVLVYWRTDEGSPSETLFCLGERSTCI